VEVSFFIRMSEFNTKMRNEVLHFAHKSDRCIDYILK